jgi:hypothetical protein
MAELTEMSSNHTPAEGGEYFEDVMHQVIELIVGDERDRSRCRGSVDANDVAGSIVKGLSIDWGSRFDQPIFKSSATGGDTSNRCKTGGPTKLKTKGQKIIINLDSGSATLAG